MGHEKSKKNIALAKGSKVSVTLTFRRSERLELQILNSMKMIREYVRAYKELTLVPELGLGRLHYHFCGSIYNVLKHKCFMHNWNAKYGNVHVDTWDGTLKFIEYLKKEDVLHSLLPNELPKGYVIKTAENITGFMKLYRARYFKEVKYSCDELNYKKTYELKPISSFFQPPEANETTPKGRDSEVELDSEDEELRYQSNMQMMLDTSSDDE